MADGRHFEKKTLNHHISATVRPILMTFNTMTHIGLWHRMNCKNFEFLKIQYMAAAAVLKNHKKSRHLRNGLTNVYEILYADAQWAS